ncbi:MAG: diphosphomevalonate decarboxylase, partial [Bradymonadaceae bacterium]
MSFSNPFVVMRATAVAHPNIAFVKYWGKRDIGLNLPATGSVSMTLGGLETETTVEFDESYEFDRLELDGEPLRSGRERERVEAFLDLVRQRAGLEMYARVHSFNDFPTAGGLASSAAGFAALARAATAAADLEIADRELSALARRGSGSAARSIFGGFVEMLPGAEEDGSDAHAQQIADVTHWDLRCLVAETTAEEKPIGSTQGMVHTEESSPFYDAWLDVAAGDVESATAAIRDRDFETLGDIAVTSAMRMHASAIAADPPLLYWNGTTVDLIHRLERARRDGMEVFYSIDAGPHVKIFCTDESESEVLAMLETIEEVHDIHETRPGPGVKLTAKGE